MKGQKFISLILTIATLMSVLCIGAIPASAATSFSSSNTAPSNSDYVYWNGSKMVKSSSMNKSKIRYIQQFLNWCIDNSKISSANLKAYGASKLYVDGSFGPASKKATQAFQKQNKLEVDGKFGPNTIKKMKSIISSSDSSSSGSTTTTFSSSKITTESIQKVLDKYNYTSGRYWTHEKGKSETSGYMSTTRAVRADSYVYEGKECYGFANFVMHEVTGTTVNPNNNNKNGWKKYTSSEVKELKVGDIVRIGKSNSDGHSGIVLTVDSKGNCTFAECWGGVNNKINIGGKLSSTKYGSHSTLSSMKNSGNLLYVYRYEG